VKAASWNVNSIRARMPVFLDWLEREQPDILVLQETKVEDDKFPLAELEHTGYEIKYHGQKSYNGVAVLSKGPFEMMELGFCDDSPMDCRIMQGVYQGIRFINTYVPNGTSVGSERWAYKLWWLEHFDEWCRERLNVNDPTIWLGDINIAPTMFDVYEPENKLGGVGHHPDEFSRLEKIVDWGWSDSFRRFTQGPGHYTFFDFRMRGSFSRNNGWRIDHVYASPGIHDRILRCWHDPEPRKMERPSDHLPVLVEIA
jgi:exodeoxyribonuclease-3